jgi:hypothetical protein
MANAALTDNNRAREAVRQQSYLWYGTSAGGRVRLLRLLPAGFPAGLLVAIIASLLVGCSAPEYTYVSSSKYNTVFRVPADWNRIPEEELEKTIFGDESASAQVAAENAWVAGFDASEKPKVDHLFGSDAQEPSLYAVVRDLDPQSQGQLSLDGMRNLLLPVTEEARQRAEAAGVAPEGFELLQDELLEEEGGLRGVRVVFNYDLGESLQTFDQTVLVDQSTSRVHLLLVRCSAKCYRERGEELKNVAASFTVKKN